jgi:hypothetical protein
VISRLKILGKLDIAERRRPQDSSFRVKVERKGKQRSVDLRVSVDPLVTTGKASCSGFCGRAKRAVLAGSALLPPSVTEKLGISC